MTKHPEKFPKPQLEALLKPFKENGELNALRKNK